MILIHQAPGKIFWVETFIFSLEDRLWDNEIDPFDIGQTCHIRALKRIIKKFQHGSKCTSGSVGCGRRMALVGKFHIITLAKLSSDLFTENGRSDRVVFPLDN
jgi:hypothetical protein